MYTSDKVTHSLNTTEILVHIIHKGYRYVSKINIHYPYNQNDEYVIKRVNEEMFNLIRFKNEKEEHNKFMPESNIIQEINIGLAYGLETEK